MWYVQLHLLLLCDLKVLAESSRNLIISNRICRMLVGKAIFKIILSNIREFFASFICSAEWAYERSICGWIANRSYFGCPKTEVVVISA
jgi:hypothetical protein